jgi:threonine dehydrogenase-like Zn-dependent dehydrogenase
MRAVAWHGRRDVRVDTVPDPAIEEPQAYETFQKKQDGAIKILLQP